MKHLKNKVQLIGHLGRDPEVKYLKSGRVVANFTLATNSYYYNQQGEKVEDTQWHSLVAWNKSAEFTEKYLRKGTEVAIEGRLVHRHYETGDGQTRYISEIIVQEILILSKKAPEVVAY